MPFLTIDGVEWEVVEASEGEPVAAGQIRRMYDNSARSTISSEKRVWEFQMLEMTSAEYNTLRTKFALGARVPIGGDALVGIVGTTLCMGRLTGAPYAHDGLSFLIEPTLRLEQA